VNACKILSCWGRLIDGLRRLFLFYATLKNLDSPVKSDPTPVYLGTQSDSQRKKGFAYCIIRILCNQGPLLLFFLAIRPVVLL
jgi:hypothetical protein